MPQLLSSGGRQRRGGPEGLEGKVVVGPVEGFGMRMHRSGFSTTEVGRGR